MKAEIFICSVHGYVSGPERYLTHSKRTVDRYLMNEQPSGEIGTMAPPKLTILQREIG